MRGVLLVFVFVACGSESKPPPPKQAPAPVIVDATTADAAAPRHAYALREKAALPQLDGIEDFIVQPDGTMIVVGQDGVVRVQSNLALDTKFGRAGRAELGDKEMRSHRAVVD